MNRPKILDLYCGAGGASEGYRRAGFDVYGVDVAAQPDYPFPFLQLDALRALEVLVAGGALVFRRKDGFGREAWDVLRLADFAAVHASPPCQRYTYMTDAPEAHPDLIPPTRELLLASGLPYVIENVEGARWELLEPMTLCGSSFGLRVRRHRLFESSVYLTSVPCAHGQQGEAVGVYGEHPESLVHRRPTGSQRSRGRRAVDLDEARAAMGMSWGSWYGVTQAIPPAYSEWIGLQLLRELSHLQEVSRG